MEKYPAMSPEIYEYISERRLPHCDGNYLEIGSYTGGGIVSLAKKFPNKKFYSVESFVLCPESIWKFIENTTGISNIHLIASNSLILNQFIKSNNLSILDFEKINVDTILIDGSHLYKDVTTDIDTAIRLLTDKNGFIFFHDAFNVNDVSIAIDEFRNKYENSIISEDSYGDGRIFFTKFK